MTKHYLIIELLCRQLIDSIVNSSSGILVTSYDQMRIQRDDLLDVSWGYCILDEGHKIRNPDAEVSVVVLYLQGSGALIVARLCWSLQPTTCGLW